MQTKGWTLLRALLNKYGHHLSPQEFQEVFLSDAPAEESKKILGIELTSSNPEIILQFQENSLGYIHYSWLVPIMQKLPTLLQSRVLGLLPAHQQESIAKTVEIEPVSGSYLEPIRRMLIKTFFGYLNAEGVLPKEYLPHTPLVKLLDLSKDDLVTLIDLLSMHDLAEDMRQIVDNKTIKAVYRCLKPYQHRHLYICLHQQEKVVSPPLDLAGWNGNCTTLQKKLHIRGMIRLGKALSGQHPDFVWHLIHTFDTGRGSILKEYIQAEPIPKITPALQQQVIQTINYIKSDQ